MKGNFPTAFVCTPHLCPNAMCEAEKVATRKCLKSLRLLEKGETEWER